MSVQILSNIEYTSSRNSTLEELAEGYLSDMETYEGVQVIVHEKGVTVKAPYDKRFVKGAKKVGGRWDSQEKAWVFPVEVSADAIHLVHEEYSHLKV